MGLFWCLASVACGQTADRGQADSSASGGSAGSATSTGGQPESTGGSSASGGSSDGTALTTGGAASSGGVENTASGGLEETGGAAPRVPSVCNVPSASPWGGGLLLCGDGSYRRPQAESCNTEVPRPAPGATCHDGDECCLDADCAAAPHGFCSYGACLYGCVSDSDCSGDSLCLCQDPIGRCMPTACHSDAECAAGVHCRAVASLRGFSCEPPTTACVSGFDCSSGVCGNGICVPFSG